MQIVILGLTAMLAFLFGASIFSFLNVVAYRLPRGMDYVRGRSACPACGHALSAVDMLPVLGYLLRRGRCHYCGARIPPRYPLGETLGGAAAILSFGFYEGRVAAGLTCLAFLSVLYVVALVDQDTMEIPNGFVLAMAAVAVVSYFVFPKPGLVDRLIGLLSVSLPLFLITLAVPNAFGGGDIKLMAAVGLYLGWRMNLVAAALAVLTGGFYGIYLLLAKKADRKAHFAFGPFLCAGAAAAVFLGQPLLSWYLGFFK